MKRPEDKPKKINRSHKEYPEKFYQDIMDDSYRPINKIWVDEWLHKAGIYVGILNGHRKISSYKEWYKNMMISIFSRCNLYLKPSLGC